LPHSRLLLTMRNSPLGPLQASMTSALDACDISDAAHEIAAPASTAATIGAFLIAFVSIRVLLS
jgi:hypothetical protein